MVEATALQRKWRCEINMATPEAPDWQRLVGLQEFNPSITPVDQEDDDYESDGWQGDTRTARKFGIESNISYRQDSATFVANPVHEKLRLAAAAINPEDGVIHFRYYDRFGGVEAHEGFALVTWEPDGGGMTDLQRVGLTFGPSATSPALVDIANPLNATPEPIVSGLSPATGAAAGGNQVTISGAYFTGATDVDFGVDAATEFTLVSASTIVAIAPAVAASTVNVTVTTPNGVSDDTAADDYIYT